LLGLRGQVYVWSVMCLQSIIEKEVLVPFSSFCQSFSVEAPYTVHALPSQTVYDFLSQWHNKLCHFITDIMDHFGWRLGEFGGPATNQPA